MKVGIQLYSVRNSMAQDSLGTIEKVVNAGYKNLEVANHNADVDSGVGFGVSAYETNELINKLDAHIVSAHIFPMNPERIDAVLEYHKILGTKFIVMPMAFYFSHQDALDMAEQLNRVGEKCALAGMELLYHNHFHELQVFDGETVYETIMKNTDPALVKIELDTYWILRGKQNPVAFLKKFGKRVRLLHQKDYPFGYDDELDLLTKVGTDPINMERFVSEVDEKTFTEIGKGIIPIQEIINTAVEYCDVDYIILEQDYTQHDEMESIKISMDSFRKFTGVTW